MNNNKTPQDSYVETRYIVMPQHTNHYGTTFGGTILSWIDMTAAMVAERHSGHEAVTVSMDSISFFTPISVGDHVILKAQVNYVGNTSMEIGVTVFKENPYNQTSCLATSAYLTFVGLDKNKTPVKLPPISLVTDEEKLRYKEAELRVKSRKALSKEIESERHCREK